MPTIDHDERRRRIAEVAVDVIAREGLESATIRRIAAELKGPTKLVTHYFTDKQQLLIWTYRSLAEQGERYIEEVVARDPADLLGSLFAMTPMDEHKTQLWRVYVAFWDWASRDPVIAELQRKYINLTVLRIAEMVRALTGDTHDLESVSERLNAVVQGISIQALMDKERWSAQRIRSRLADEVAAALARSSPA
ncbi:MAG: TetR/AcrR family transcriptional regulator [Rhizomicrobium sp.]